MFKRQKTKILVVAVGAFFVTSSLFTNCAKSLPPQVSKTTNLSNEPAPPAPVPLTASYAPAIVRILATATVTPFGGKSPYVMSKLAGAGTFDAATGVYTAPNVPEEATIRVTDNTGTIIDIKIPIVPLEVTAGTKSFSPGNSTFTVPTYNSLLVEVWGAGGGGQACGVVYPGIPVCNGGNSGGASVFGANLLVAQGGQGVNGGSASGGTINVKGENGNYNNYNCPGLGGGAGGPAGILIATRQGNFPGGGGNGTCNGWGANGGGGGGYSAREYLPGQLAVGAAIPVSVGSGGAYSGAAGLVKITWK